MLMGKAMFDPKKLLPIPGIILLLSLVIIYTSWSGGTVPMGVDLKGGTMLIIPTSQPIEGLDALLSDEFGLEASSRSIRDFSGNIKQQEIVINKKDLSLDEEKEIKDSVLSEFESRSIEHGDILSETVSGFFSEMFLRESVKAVVFAFLFMAVVIFVKFKTFVPSFAVVLSAFSDIVETVATMIVLGIELSKGSIVALLLLIGYSVDTDIMLTSRILKQKGRKNLDETVKHSMFTGFTMTGTTTTAMIVLLIVSTSELLDSIATVIIIGLVFDLLNTWITNLSLLKMHVEGGGK
jgi:preprotein translocase subunit SecF